MRGRRTVESRKRTADAPTRRRAVRRRWVAVLVVVSVLAAGYVLVFTSLLGVRSVEVSGVKRLTRAEVLRLADIPQRRAMLRIDTDEVEQRLVSLPEVRSVAVSRSWPSTIEVEIVERSPVAYFRAADGIRLVDQFGVPFHRQRRVPMKLPELELAKVSSADPTTRAVTAVLTGVPASIRKKITKAGARTPGSVEFTLDGGKTVRWGDTAQLDRKARVLVALLTRPGRTYDVSSPELPTVS